MANYSLQVKPCHTRPERLHIQSNLNEIFTSKKNKSETSKLRTQLDEISKREFLSRKTRDYDVFTTNRFLKNVRCSSGYLRKSNYRARPSLFNLKKAEARAEDTSPLTTARSGISLFAPAKGRKPILSTSLNSTSEVEATLPPAHLLSNRCTPLLRYKCIRRLARSLTADSAPSDSCVDSMVLRPPSRIVLEYCDHSELEKVGSRSSGVASSLARRESSVHCHVGRILSASGRRRLSTVPSVYSSD